MDSYHDRLVREINAELDRLAERRDKWVAKWITHSICESHRAALPDSDGSEFWRWNASRNVREMVRKQINRRAGDDAERGNSAQLDLDGFSRKLLQDYYLTEREGRDVGVPVTDMTDTELQAKAHHYRAMGATCFEHAKEIERFVEWRHDAMPDEYPGEAVH